MLKGEKNQFPRSGQRDAFNAVPSHDPEIGNSKGSSDLRSKNRRFYPLREPSLTSLFSPFELFRVNGFFSARFFRFFFLPSTVPCDLQKSGEYAGYASSPLFSFAPWCHMRVRVRDHRAVIFQNHEKIYLHPAMLSRRPRGFSPLFFKSGSLFARREKNDRAASDFTPK